MAGVVFGLGVLFILCSQLIPVVDQHKVLLAAADMRKHDFRSFDKYGYMDMCPHQSGLVLFYYLLSFLVGNYNYIAMQVLNAAAFAACCLLISRLAGNFWGKERGKYAGMMFLAFVPFFFYITYVYGTLLGLAAALGAVCLEISYFRERKPSQIVGASVLMAAAVQLKQNYLIVLIAMVIFLLYDVAVREKKARSLCFILVLLLCWQASDMTVKGSMERLTGYPVSSGEPMNAYVAMGLQEGNRAPGWWNSYNNGVYKDNGCDTEVARALAAEDIRGSLRRFRDDPPYMIRFFIRKTASQWNNPSFEGLQIMSRLKSTLPQLPPAVESLLYGRLGDWFISCANALQTWILAGTFFYLVIRRKKIKAEELFPAMIFTGGFLFHLVWEAQCTYTVAYFALLCPYAAEGLGLCASGMETAVSAAARWRREGIPWRRLVKPALGLLAALLVCAGFSVAFRQMNDDRQEWEEYRRELETLKEEKP